MPEFTPTQSAKGKARAEAEAKAKSANLNELKVIMAEQAAELLELRQRIAKLEALLNK